MRNKQTDVYALGMVRLYDWMKCTLIPNIFNLDLACMKFFRSLRLIKYLTPFRKRYLARYRIMKYRIRPASSKRSFKINYRRAQKNFQDLKHEWHLYGLSFWYAGTTILQLGQRHCWSWDVWVLDVLCSQWDLTNRLIYSYKLMSPDPSEAHIPIL